MFLNPYIRCNLFFCDFVILVDLYNNLPLLKMCILNINLECKFCGIIILHIHITIRFFLLFISPTLSLSLTFSFFHTHLFITVTRCLSLLLCIVSFKWVIEEQYVHHWYTVSSTQQSPGKWQAVHEERRQFVLSVCACLWVYGCDRRGWNVLCSNMLYFPTVTRTESLSLSLPFLSLFPSILSGAGGLKRQVRYSDKYSDGKGGKREAVKTDGRP